MRSFDPDSEEAVEMTRDNQRAVFAAKMQHEMDAGRFTPADYCPACEMLRSQCECIDPVNQP